MKKPNDPVLDTCVQKTPHIASMDHFQGSILSKITPPAGILPLLLTLHDQAALP